MRLVQWELMVVLGLAGCGSDSSALTRPMTSNGGTDGGPVKTAGGAGSGGAAGGTACKNSLDCSGGNVCDRARGQCVECVTSSDCRPGYVCANDVCRSGCASDKECTSVGQLCDKAAGHCVDCLVDQDCSQGGRCNGGVCESPGGGGGAGGAGGFGGGFAGVPQGGAGGAGFGGLAGLPFGGSGGGLGCQAQIFDATQAALDMVVLLDQSGSMNETVTAGGTGGAGGVSGTGGAGGASGTKWSVISQAFDAFLSAPENATVGVALAYFPLTIPGVPATCAGDVDCGAYGPCVGGINLGGTIIGGTCQQADVCQVASYAKPEVPFVLPPNHAAAVASIANHAPAGGTPTTPALTGVVQYATAWATQHHDRKVVIVLATDGDPTGCTTNAATDVANVAQGALATSGIPTYVVGVGNSLTSLNQVAVAGGTTQAYLLATSADLGTTFQNAMNQIRARSAPCSFGLPSGASGDPSLLNVIYTPPGGAARLIPRSTGTCTSSGGWQYDASSSQIVVCASTCALFAPGGGLQVEVGCPSVVGP